MRRISPRSQLGRQFFAKRLPIEVTPSKYGNRAQRRAWERLYGPIAQPDAADEEEVPSDEES